MEEEPRDLRLGVMDDDPAVASVAASMVEVLGGEGRAVSQLPELMEMIEHWRPSHLVIDLVMPDVDGMQVLKALADAGCRARIIICSGMSDGVLDAAMRSASAHGLDVVGVLPKPFRLRELKALLERPLTPLVRRHLNCRPSHPPRRHVHKVSSCAGWRRWIAVAGSLLVSRWCQRERRPVSMPLRRIRRSVAALIASTLRVLRVRPLPGSQRGRVVVGLAWSCR